MEAINKSSGVDDQHYNTVVQSLAALVDTAQSLFCNGVLSFEKLNVLRVKRPKRCRKVLNQRFQDVTTTRF